jgi:hypothetical protein
MENKIKKPSKVTKASKPKKLKMKSPLEMVTVVCNRGDGDIVLEILEANHIYNALIFNAEGTAESEVASLFGFGVVERDVVAALVEAEQCKAIVETLYSDLKLNLSKNGIVFSIKLSSATKQLLQLFTFALGE